MELWQALLLGLLQGVSELFPVSSLAHTIILPALLHWNLNQEANSFLAFVVALHLATAIALLLYFRRQWLDVLRAYAGSFQQRKLVYDDASKFAWLLVAGTIVVGGIGLLLEKRLRSFFEDPSYVWLVALILVLNGVLMLGGDYVRRRAAGLSTAATATHAQARPNMGATSAASLPSAPVQMVQSNASEGKRAEELTFGEGALVGATQTLALFPGISRSGMTIVAGLLAKLSYEEAARFSFMLATPVIGLAALLKVPDLFKPESRAILNLTIPAAVVAGLTAYLSVRFLMRYFETQRLSPFGYYCIAAGALALVLLKLGI
ncbi:MAG: undecaprenyl-diphosphate phosphatase [Chloroflexota bacterium]|nr:undecaprenyl-diphosphate phosphatase [Chloroflexota bacterium]